MSTGAKYLVYITFPVFNEELKCDEDYTEVYAEANTMTLAKGYLERGKRSYREGFKPLDGPKFRLCKVLEEVY